MDAHCALALDVQKAIREHIAFHLAETRLHTSWKVFNTSVMFEVRMEELRLVILNFTVLHRSTTQGVVQLNGFIRSNTCLILGSFGSQPEVDSPCQTTRFTGSCGKQDIGVSDVKLSINLSS